MAALLAHQSRLPRHDLGHAPDFKSAALHGTLFDAATRRVGGALSTEPTRCFEEKHDGAIKSVFKHEEAQVTKKQDRGSGKPQSMTEADTANGEGPEDSTPRPAAHKTPVAHATGERQAKENLDNDPPA